VRTITGVATSVAALVDRFARGPLNKPVQLFGMADFERELGGLSRGSEASYAIQQFFLNGGSECFVVRVANTTAPSTPTTPAAEATALLRVQPSAGATVLNVKAGRLVGDESAPDPGVWGNNLHLEVDYDTADPSNAFNLTVSEVVSEGGRRITRRSESHRNLRKVASGPGNAVETLNAASLLIQSRPAPAGPPTCRPRPVPWARRSTPRRNIPATPVALTVNAGAAARRSPSPTRSAPARRNTRRSVPFWRRQSAPRRASPRPTTSGRCSRGRSSA